MGEGRETRLQRVLEELIGVAERAGVKVRREKLLREVGYRARGGFCRLRTDAMVIIDREQPAYEQLEIVAEALKRQDLEAVYLSPAARRLLRLASAGG